MGGGRVEVLDVLAYLRLAINPDDDASFLRALTRPPRPGLGPGSMGRRRLLAEREPTAALQFGEEEEAIGGGEGGGSGAGGGAAGAVPRPVAPRSLFAAAKFLVRTGALRPAAFYL